MKMIAENAETVRVNGYSTFVVGFDDVTIEAFADAFNAAFANKTPANIYTMIAFVGNATEDTNTAIEQGYLTDGDRISEIISLINQYADFDDESNDIDAEKTLDKATNTATMGAEGKQACQSKESTVNIKKTLASVVVWYNPTTQKVSLAKCRTTGKFVSLAVAQGLLNVELGAIRLPCVPTVRVDYSFAQTLCILFLALLVAGLLSVFGLLVAYALPIQAMLTFIAAGMFGMMLCATCEDHLHVSFTYDGVWL